MATGQPVLALILVSQTGVVAHMFEGYLAQLYGVPGETLVLLLEDHYLAHDGTV